MKSLAQTTILIMILLWAVNVHGQKFAPEIIESPLFHGDPGRISMPQGNYSFIRAYREVTQILVSSNWSILTLHTKREAAYSIQTKSFSRIDCLRLEAKPLTQGEFVDALINLLQKGDTGQNTTLKYPGFDQFYASAKEKQGSLKKLGFRITATIPWKYSDTAVYKAVLVIDIRRRECLMKIYKKLDTIDPSQIYYPVRILDAGNRLIVDMIYDYYNKFHELL